MKKASLIFCLILSLWLINFEFGQSQSKSVQGQIIHEKDQTPIADIQVTLSLSLLNQSNWRRVSYTDQAGNFQFSLPDSLEYKQAATLVVQPSEASFMNLKIPISLAENRPYIIPLNLPELDEEAELLANQIENAEDKVDDSSFAYSKPELQTQKASIDTVNTGSPIDNTQVVSNSPSSPPGNGPRPLKSVEKLNLSLENITLQLREEKEFIAGRNERINKEIQRMFDELAKDEEITPEEKSKFIKKLEALEKQLQENILSYQKLQQTTQEEINRMRRMILGNNYSLYVYKNVIMYLVLAILVLVSLIWGGIYVFRRIQKERNKFQSLSQQKARLLKEIHHRVKNNLQNVNSILNLQSDTLENTQVLDAIKDIQSRIYSMALIHKVLHQSDEHAYIEIKGYLEKLVSHLASTFNTENRQINYQVNAENAHLDVDTATNLGLIINELVSNAYKYAFRNKDEGNIHLNLHKVEVGRYRLEVLDDGVGLSESFNLAETRTLGLQLVQCFAEELSGKVEVIRQPGTQFVIHFEDRVEATV